MMMMMAMAATNPDRKPWFPGVEPSTLHSRGVIPFLVCEIMRNPELRSSINTWGCKSVGFGDFGA